MLLIEVVIDSAVDLSAVAGRFANAEQIIRAAEMVQEAVAGGVQTINGRVVQSAPVVRCRHERDRAVDQTRRIFSCTVLVPGRTADCSVGAIGIGRAAAECDGAEYAD